MFMKENVNKTQLCDGSAADLSKAEMLDSIEQFYAAAGFTDFCDESMKDLPEDEIRQMYLNCYTEEKPDQTHKEDD